MPRKKKMSDWINTTRSSEIYLEDESMIDLTITIAIHTDAAGCLANERIRSTHLSETLTLVEYMVVTACQYSLEEREEMQKQHGK
jgi:hypothetical protein